MSRKRSHLHHVSHRIKHFLSIHISILNLKRLAFVIALVSCLSAGSIMLFTLFSTSLHELLGFTYLQVNFIASLSAIGMYLCLPVLGYLGDKFGPALLSLISIWFFCPSYFINSALVANLRSLPRTTANQSYVYGFSFTFCLIGLATSSLYFSSLLTCAKIYPNHKSLAISLPITCYGLSSLIGSQLLKLEFFRSESSDYLDLYRVFNFFGILYFFMGVLNFVSSSIVIVEQEIIFNGEETEESALLPDSSTSSLALDEDEESNVDLDDDLDLATQRSIIEPPNHHERYILFLKDKSAWLLLFSLVLNIGPLESYQNNLGSTLKNITHNVDLSNEVSIMAAFSTVFRLALGGLSDYVSSPNRKSPMCRIWLMVAVLVVGVIGQLGHNYLTLDNDHFYYILAGMNGTAYGGLFTIYPTVVASIWGIDIMGSTWGSFMVAPAIGSIVYSLNFGRTVDTQCAKLNVLGLSNCLSSYYTLTAFSLSVSLFLILFVWKGIWVKRGFVTF
ncbi:monocarboxylate permease [Scheffersomyces xylosifermentans]|uniref:monocarboxylate permease n=1 Tax=Scheffersomyces xylosifermentans TaxID=1304137 RepID=UPI00315D11FF